MPAFDEYTYVAVLGVIFGFGMAFGIGSNDAANAFASSVSAKSLQLKHAIFLGFVMESAGAILLGSSVTGTIRHKILKASYFEDDPEIFMFGSLTALIIGMSWLLLATHLEFPVSTTHDIVAAYLGFGIAAKGWEAVDWWPTTGKIIISWFVAPIFAGIIGFVFFKTLMEVVLKSEGDVFARALKVYPLVVFVAITANTFFVMSKSADNNVDMSEEDWNKQVVLPSSFGAGVLCAVLTWLVICPWLKTRVEVEHEEREAELAQEAEKGTLPSSEHPVPSGDPSSDVVKADQDEEEGDDVPESLTLWDRFANNTFRQDLEKISLSENKRAAAIWESSTQYDMKAEHLFQYLQIFTASLAAFSHGSNDVANAIAPVSGILQIYQDGVFDKHADVNRGILAMGGLGIGFGFLFFGYRIIKAVGYKLTSISPSRGFCIELAASLSVSLASYCQIPVSTTQCLVGATCGVGLAVGGVRNVEWWFLLRTCSGWAGVFVIVALVNAGFFAFCVLSPSL